MANEQADVVWRQLRKILAGSADQRTDAELLAGFIAHREEGAFAALVRRHGPMVLGVCRRVLRDEHLAEDAFQATFLVLARKAPSLANPGLVGNWLHGVAQRIAREVRTKMARRQTRERPTASTHAPDPATEAEWRELRAVLDEELAQLPEKYRAPLILCDLEGQTHAEAARTLGIAPGSMSRRLARGRELLREKLVQRGLSLPTGLLTAGLSRGAVPSLLPASLVTTTVKAGLTLAAGGTLCTGTIPARVVEMVEGALRATSMSKCKPVLALLLAASVGAAGVGFAVQQHQKAEGPQAGAARGPHPVPKGKGQTARSPVNEPYRLDVVLHVAEHPPLTRVLREQVGRELGDALRAALGPLARVRVLKEHPRLEDVLTRGLQKALDGWAERSEVKTHFVLIDYSGGNYQIQARQHDGMTGLSSPAVRRGRTPDRASVARRAALLVQRDLGLCGTVVAGPDARQTVQVQLRGGGPGVDLSRWVHKGDVFALVPPGNPPTRPVPFALLRVQQPPTGKGDSTCVCRLFLRYRLLAAIVGDHGIKLGTTRAPLRLLLVREKPDGSLGPPQEPLFLQVRRESFEGEAPLRLEVPADGKVDTSGLGEKGLFEDVAFVSLLNRSAMCLAVVPVGIISDQPVVVPVPATPNDPLRGPRKE